MLNLITAFKETKPKSSFEKHLQDRLSWADLNQTKGVYYLQRNELKKAEQFLAKSKRTEVVSCYSYEGRTNQYGVFNASNYTYFNQAFSNYSTTAVAYEAEEYEFRDDLLALVQKLIYIEESAEKSASFNANVAAVKYYNLGVAWNNMSPYGYFRSTQYSMSNDNCCNDFTNGVFNDSLNEGHHFNFRKTANRAAKFYNANIAISHLNKALNLATSNELKAKIMFKLAEAELFKNYSAGGSASWHYRGSNGRIVPDKAQEWFRKMKDFEDTQYYKEAIQECWYFKMYAN